MAHNAEYRTGKVSSIKTGLSAASPDADAVFLLAVDQPRSSNIVRAVVDEYASTRAPITIPTNGGHAGHPLLFDRALLPELRSITEDTQGIRAVMQRHASDALAVELADPAVNLDLNTPEDFRRSRFHT